jgi:hypothetical protein
MGPATIRACLRALAVLACLGAATAHPALGQKLPPRADDPGPRPPRAPSKAGASATTGAVVVVTGVGGAKVQLFRVARGSRTVLVGTRAADPQGNVSFPSLRPGAYRVVVSSPDYDDATEEVAVTAGRPETVNGRPRPRFGDLTLTGAEVADGASIELDGKAVDASRIARGADGSARIRTTPGKHRVRVSKRGFEPFVAEVEVPPGGETRLPVDVKREMTSILVRGTPGTRLYVDRIDRGVIPTTAEIEVRQLVPGQRYDLRFELEDHQPRTDTIQPEAGTVATIDATLEPLPTSGPFEELFVGGLGAWDAPGTWRAGRGVLTVRGSELGIARDSWYADFEMIFALRLGGPRGAAWAVRARDVNNYYLFVLGGPEGPYPNQLRAYVVAGGVFDPAAPASTQPVIPPLRPGETYRVRVRAEGGVIQHWLTPASTGEEVSVGLFNDVKRSFPLGRIGFVAPHGEVFQISGLSARPDRETQNQPR